MSGLLEDLRRVGRHHSSGTFSLDRKKAQEKMREFQLVDPHEYVLQLVAAAVSGGATRIEVRIEGQQVVLTAHGWTLSPEIMEQPLAGLFLAKDQRQHEHVRHFSIGLNALFALQPRSVDVTSGGLSAHLDTNGDATVGHVKPPLDGTRVGVEGRWTWRDVLRLVGAASVEATLLEQRAGWAPIPISVNGRAISCGSWKESAAAQAARLGPVVASIEIEEEGMRALLWTDGTFQLLARWIYVRHGILVEESHHPLPPLEPALAIYCDALTTNASESGIVENARQQAVAAAMEQLADRLLVALCKRYAADSAPPLRKQLLHAAAMTLGRGPTAWESDCAVALARLPFFETLDGKPITLGAMHDEIKASSRVRCTQVPIAPPHPRAHLVVKVDGAQEMAILRNIFGERVEAISQYGELFRRQVNMARWRMSAPRRHIEPNRCLVTVPVAVDGFTGELGLPVDAPPPPLEGETEAEITFLVGERFLCRRRLGGTLRYVAVIEHPDMSINLTWDDVEQGEVYTRALAVLDGSYERACEALVSQLGDLNERRESLVEAVRDHLLRMLRRRQALGGEAVVPAFVMDIPLVPTLQGTRCTLRRLREEAAERGKVAYVIDARQGPQMDERIIVSVQKRPPLTLPFLKYVTPGVAWTDYSNRLASERLTLALEKRPCVKPEVSQTALFPTPFKRREIFGVVAIGSGDRCEVKLLRKGRLLEVRNLSVALHPLEGAVDSPFLSADDSLSKVQSGPALERVAELVSGACDDLAVAAAAGLATLTGVERMRTAAFLHSYMRLRSGKLSGVLEACPLFRAVDGSPVTLLQIRESLRKSDAIRFVSDVVPGASNLERLTLALDFRDRETLVEVFGHKRLVDWSRDIRAELMRSAFLQRPIVERALPPGDYFRVQPIAHDGLEGQVGLLDGGGESGITVLHEDRVLAVVPCDPHIPARAVVWSSRVLANGSFSGPAPEAIAVIQRVVREAIEKAMLQLCQEDPPFHSRQARMLMAFVLDSVKSPQELLAKADWSALARIASRAMFERSDGQRTTLIEIARQSLEKGYVRWVKPADCGWPLDGILAVRLDDQEVAIMERLFPAMQAYTAKLREEALVLERLKASARVDRIQIADGVTCIERLAVDADGVRGELGIAAEPTQAGIVLVHGGFALDRVRPYPGLPIVGMLASDQYRPRPAWDGISLSAAQESAVRKMIDGLFARLGEAEPERPRELLFAYYMLRKSDWLTRARLEDASLRVPLFSVAGGGRLTLGDLIRTFFHERTILVSAQPAAAAGREKVVVARREEEQYVFLEQFFGTWNVKLLDGAPAPKETAAAHVSAVPAAAVPEGVLDRERVLPPAESVPPPADPVGRPAEPVPVPAEPLPQPAEPVPRPAEPLPQPAEPLPQPSGPVPHPAGPVPQPAGPVPQSTGPVPQIPQAPVVRSPADVMADNIAACFRHLALTQQYDWRTDVFEQVQMVRAPRRRELVFVDGQLRFNIAHDLAERLLSDPDARINVAFCASALFTAYNQCLENVTDLHEVRFMEELLLWVES